MKNLSRRQCFGVIAGLLAGGTALPSFSASKVIRVSLWDKGATTMNMLGQGPMMAMGMGGRHMDGNGHMGPMGIQVSSHTIKAGSVTFEVKNDSRELVHEMVISPVKDVATPLPYDKPNQKVDEDAAGHLGEVAELEPGKSGALRIDLKPGRYILYCNIAGHYVLGMWTLLTVTA
jgi:uncharacterized cupredoxin-like copper-binding protein